ncbi:amidohydrolase family protein, partial [bacterium]|nr:amidohydrolase family protein [bacterium]
MKSIYSGVSTVQNHYDDEFQGDLIIKNINIIDLEKFELKEDQTIIITGNRITSISDYSATNKLQATYVIDGSDKYIIPGLWDMHTHVLANFEKGSFKQVPNPTYLENFNKLMVANGVLGFRDMYGGDASMKLYRKKIDDGDYFPQHFLYSNHILDGNPPRWPFNLSVSTPKEAVETVDMLAKTGTDYIKIYDNLSPEVFQAVAKRCQEIGIDMVGHIPAKVKVIDAINAGLKSSEHIVGIEKALSTVIDSLESNGSNPKDKKLILETQDNSLGSDLFKLMKEKEHWVVPTLTVLNGVVKINSGNKTPEEKNFKYIPYASNNEMWDDYKYIKTEEDYNLRVKWTDRIKEIVGLLHKNSIGLLVGTDFAYDNPYTYPGISVHEEMKNLTECGLSNGEALKAATLNPAKYLNALEYLGTVTVNKMADLVILNKNPLENIKNTKDIYAVISNGKLF